MQYWWLDFQQQPFTSVPLLNPTIACNHAWYTNPWRYGPGADASKAKDRPYVMGAFRCDAAATAPLRMLRTQPLVALRCAAPS